MTGSPPLTPGQRAFLAASRSGALATIDGRGRPRLVPICFAVRGEAVYSPLDEKPKRVDDPHALARVHDLRERPAATLLVERWSEDWTELGWLRIDVRGELLEPGGAEHDAAVAALRAKYPQYATHRLEARPMIRLTVEGARSWGNLAAGDG